jgi:hypothetical protein
LEICIREIIYRTDSAEMLFDAKKAGKFHESAKRKADLQALKVSSVPAPVSAESVFVAALVDHFQGVAESAPNLAFSMPAVQTGSIGGSMAAVGSTASAKPKFDDDVMDVLEPADGQAAGDELLFFKVVKSRPSAWHTVPMSKAAGAKLKRSDVAVSLHRGCIMRGKLVRRKQLERFVIAQFIGVCVC